MVRITVLALFAISLIASEARLELPGQLAPGVPTEGAVVAVNASGRVQSIEWPDLAGVSWQVRGRTVQSMSINGETTRSEHITISVTADQAGPLVISGVTVIMEDGSRIVAPDRTIQVTAGNPDLSGEARFTVSFSPADAWVGQPVTMEFSAAFSSESLRMEKIGISPPSQATLLDDPNEVEDSALAADGSRWRTVTKRWTVTFSTAGTFEVRGQQEYYRCQRDVFDRWVAVSQARRAAVKPATLVVREVPTANRPPDWTGAVGALNLDAALDRERIVVGEGARLTITVRGPQAALVARPTLESVTDLRAYPHDNAGTTTSAGRSFSWDLVPAIPGRYTVPVPSIPWFDPDSEAFTRSAAQSLILEVLPGRSQGLNVAGGQIRLPDDAAPTVPGLPAPWRGRGPLAPAPTLLGLLLAGALLLGAACGWATSRAPREARAAHRGRALSTALRANDLPAAVGALHSLRPTLTTPAQRDAAQRLEAALEIARFGNGRLGDVSAEISVLGSIP